jgi:hypothetical protein
MPIPVTGAELFSHNRLLDGHLGFSKELEALHRHPAGFPAWDGKISDSCYLHTKKYG